MNKVVFGGLLCKQYWNLLRHFKSFYGGMANKVNIEICYVMVLET